MALGWILGTIGVLLFDRYGSRDRSHFAKDLDESIMVFTAYIFLGICVAIVSRVNSGNMPSITNTGSGSEARERVNRSSPEVKEQ
jgi:hypothetical protein